jgi:RNA polymerase sigma-70 factor (ECF subfamily)
MNDRQDAILAEIPRLRRYARALLRDRDAADDLVQDCLERALRRLDNWRTGDSPRRWLFTIMHHLFVDQTRRTKRRGEAFPLSHEEVGGVATEASQFDALAARDVADALQSIGADRRAALVLVTVEGLSYAEAADVLGIPAGTLMSRVSRGREELRALLDGQARRKSIRIVD